jgi:hypothetical protein
MSKSFAKDKGARAERAAIELLQPVVNDITSELGLEQIRLQRNSLQSDGGGFDIVGLDWIALEVKHCETLNVRAWWEQCVNQAKTCQRTGLRQEPVLFYKQNNVKFKVMMLGLLTTGGHQNVRCPVEVSVESFLLYFRHKLKKELSE